MNPEAKRPAPLFRQYLLLAWCAGIFATRFFWPGFTAWALLLFLSLANPPRLAGRSFLQISTALLLFFSLCFGLGLSYGQLRQAPDKAGNEERQAWPAWILAAVTPDPESELYKKGLRLRARVDAVHALTDRRLQIILDQPTPVADAQNQALNDKTPFSGKLVLTWYDSPTPEVRQPPDQRQRAAWRGRAPLTPLPARPLPGQILEISLRLREVRGLQNPGLWDPENYWRDRGVRLRAWTNGSDGDPRLLPSAAGLNGTNAPADEPAGGAAAWREHMRQGVNAALPRLGPGDDPNAPAAPGASFIPALLFGDKYLQSSAEADLMARSTLAHSLALSGLHLGYVAGLAYALVYALFRLFPGLGLWLPQRRLAAAAALPPALFYVWLGGGAPSLWRAWLMLLFWGLLFFLKRPAVLLDGLLWAVCGILLFTPQAAFDLRLQLSALSIAAIALVMPWLDALSRRLHDRIIALGAQPGARSARRAGWGIRQCARLARGAVIMLGISFSAQLILMPLLARAFGLYGLAFPLNLLWLPLLGFLVMPAALFGCLAAALHLPALAEGAFHLASLPCAWLVDRLDRLDSAGLLPAIFPTRPHWLFMLGYWLTLAILPWLLSRLLHRLRSGKPDNDQRNETSMLKPGLFLMAGLLLCLAPTALRHYEAGRDLVRLRLLDVGQGQAVLLEWPGGGRLLLDGGGGSSPRFDIGREIVAASLADNRPPRLEFMLASHPDQDHAGGLAFPLRYLEVGYFGDNGKSSQALLDALRAKNQPRHSLQAGDSLALAPDLRLDILWPAAPEAGPALTGNNASLVARLIWRGQALALLCGDVEAKAQRLLLKRYSPAELEAQALVLPHHGAAGASLPAFYDAVRPRLVLASAGYGNRWFMPAARTRAALRERGLPLFSTDRLGQICIEWPGQAGGVGAALLKAAREP